MGLCRARKRLAPPGGIVRRGGWSALRAFAKTAPRAVCGQPCRGGRLGSRRRWQWLGEGPTASWSQTAPCGTPDARSGASSGRAIPATWGFSGRERHEGREIGPARATGRHL